MAYKVVVGDDAGKLLPENLPVEFKNALRDMFTAIADDPIANSRVPVCPPFVPHGRMKEQWVDYQPSRYMLRVFFEVDEEREEVGVTHVSIQPRLPQSESYNE